MPLVSISEISSLYLASVAEQTGLSHTWSQTPKDRFSHDLAVMVFMVMSSTLACLNNMAYIGTHRIFGSASQSIFEENDAYRLSCISCC